MDAISRPGGSRTPPPANVAGVPRAKRYLNPGSTRTIIEMALTVLALTSPAPCRLAPPALFNGDVGSTGSYPELHFSNVPPRRHQGATLCPHEGFLTPPSGGACHFYWCLTSSSTR